MKVTLDPIVNILSKVTFTPASEIHEDTDVFDDLDLDSLGIIETLVGLEREFQVKLNPMLYSREQIQTPRKIMTILEDVVSQNNP